MDLLKADSSVVHPHLFDGTNYGYWKACMCVFIKSMDDLTWKAVARLLPLRKRNRKRMCPKVNLIG